MSNQKKIQIHNTIAPIELVNAVVTIGSFDGMHRGHLHVLRELRRRAQEVNGESVVVTFDPHPEQFFAKDEAKNKILNTIRDKEYELNKNQIDHLVVLPFSEIAAMSARQFVEEILVAILNIKHLVLGYDNRFGSDKLYDNEVIKGISEEYGFSFIRLGQFCYKQQVISSTLIRYLLLQGNIRKANDFLSYEYFVRGKVIKGRGLGRIVGFPTANIEPYSPYKLLPKLGVYMVRVLCKGKVYFGMCNIGNRPTVAENDFSFEIHLFDFDENIYGEELLVFFLRWMREEQKFTSVEALTEQLKEDKIKTLEQIKDYLFIRV